MSSDANAGIEDEIQTWFDANLDSGYISRFDIDLFHNTVVIEFRVNYSEGPQFHSVRFDGMRSIYFKERAQPWLSEAGIENEIQADDWAIREGVAGTIEWLYTLFHQPGAYTVRVSEIANSRWISTGLDSTLNFALTIMHDIGFVLIEANHLTLDDKVFDVGYPGESDTSTSGRSDT